MSDENAQVTKESPLELAPSIRALAKALEDTGWQILALELDLIQESARIEVKRFDGRLITLHAKNNRASFTREYPVVRHFTPKGGLPLDLIEMRLLGRDRGLGVRSALRKLCSYLEENSLTDFALSAREWRALFARIMVASDINRGELKELVSR